MKKIALLAGCAMLVAGSVQLTTVQAATATKEQVVKMKERNERFRESLTNPADSNYDVTTDRFGMLDIDLDGYPDLLQKYSYDGIHDDKAPYVDCIGIANVMEGSYLWWDDAESDRSWAYYSPTTGYCCFVSTPYTDQPSGDPLADLAIGSAAVTDQHPDGVRLLSVTDMHDNKVEDILKIYVNADGTIASVNTGSEYDASTQWKDIYHAYMPDPVILKCDLEYTQENLDKYLPVDEDTIRAQIENETIVIPENGYSGRVIPETQQMEKQLQADTENKNTKENAPVTGENTIPAVYILIAASGALVYTLGRKKHI